MTSKLDQICSVISECEFADDTGRKLINLMEAYRQEYSFRHQTPGFRKLWEALEEAAVFACRGDLAELPKSVIERHGLKGMLEEAEAEMGEM